MTDWLEELRLHIPPRKPRTDEEVIESAYEHIDEGIDTEMMFGYWEGTLTKEQHDLIEKQAAISQEFHYDLTSIGEIARASRPLASYPISLSRLYDACLKNDFTLEEVKLLIKDVPLQRQLNRVVHNVWHPTAEELLLYHNGAADDDLKQDVDYHLNVDKCATCQ